MKITSLTITTSKRVSIAGFGGVFIDSTGLSAFVLGAKGAATQPTVFFDRATLTNTGGNADRRLLENYGTLQLYGVTITKGDVSGAQHPTGRGGGFVSAVNNTSPKFCAPGTIDTDNSHCPQQGAVRPRPRCSRGKARQAAVRRRRLARPISHILAA